MGAREIPVPSRFVNFLHLFLISAALALIHALIGGTRLLFAFPAYLILAAAAILSLLSLRRKEAPASTAALLATVALAGYVVARAWVSPIAYLSWPDAYMAVACLILYLLAAVYVTQARHRLWLLGTLFAIALAHLWVGSIQHLETSNYHPLGLERGEISRRASGLLISGNHFAGYLEAVAMLALALAFWGRVRSLWRGLSFGLALLCYVGVAISGSRGGYLSTAFSWVVLAGVAVWLSARVGRRRVWLPLLGAMAAVALAGSAAAYLGFQNELIRSRVSRNIFEDIRISNWQATLDQFREAPWLGTGAGTHLFYGRLFRKPPLQVDPIHAHGDYLEMLSEYGIAGLALALLFLGVHLGCGFRNAHGIALQRALQITGPPRSNALAIQIGCIGAVAALAAHSVVDFNMHIPGNALLFALLFGFLANPGGERPVSPGFFSLTGMLRLGLPVLGAGMIAAVVPKMEGERLAEEARVALRDRRYALCLDLARKAVLAEPENYMSWFYLGEANRLMAFTLPIPHLKTHHYEEAVQAYRNGLRQFPHDVHTLVRLGQAYDAMERDDEAERAYRSALRWDPNLGILYRYYGGHLKRRGEADGARLAYAMARGLERNALGEKTVTAFRAFLATRKRQELD